MEIRIGSKIKIEDGNKVEIEEREQGLGARSRLMSGLG
jgi:hypothetical protein